MPYRLWGLQILHTTEYLALQGGAITNHSILLVPLSRTRPCQVKHLDQKTWLNVQLRATTPPQYMTTMQSNVLRPIPEAQTPALTIRLQALQMELIVEGMGATVMEE